MRLIFALLFLFTLGVNAQNQPDIYIYGVYYCPRKITWKYSTAIREKDHDPNGNGDDEDKNNYFKGRTMDQYVFFEMIQPKEYDEAFLAEFFFVAWHYCSKDGSQKSFGDRDKVEILVPLDAKKKYYSFKATNLDTEEESADLYEKLFAKLLPIQCDKMYCEGIIDDFKEGCGLRLWGRNECLEGLERGTMAFCNSYIGAARFAFCKQYITTTTVLPTTKFNLTTTITRPPKRQNILFETTPESAESASVMLIAVIIGFIFIIIIIIAGFLLYIRYGKLSKGSMESNKDQTTGTGTGQKTGSGVALEIRSADEKGVKYY